MRVIMENGLSKLSLFRIGTLCLFILLPLYISNFHDVTLQEKDKIDAINESLPSRLQYMIQFWNAMTHISLKLIATITFIIGTSLSFAQNRNNSKDSRNDVHLFVPIPSTSNQILDISQGEGVAIQLATKQAVICIAGRIQRNWKIPMLETISMIITILLILSQSLQYQLQALDPYAWTWHPLLNLPYFHSDNTKHKIYSSKLLQDAVNSICLDGLNHDDWDIKSKSVDESSTRNNIKKNKSFCLSESHWDILRYDDQKSSGMLSSTNQKDVETIKKGIQYTKQDSSGLVISILSMSDLHQTFDNEHLTNSSLQEEKTHNAIKNRIISLQQNVQALIPFFSKISVVVAIPYAYKDSHIQKKAFTDWSLGVDHSYDVDVLECHLDSSVSLDQCHLQLLQPSNYNNKPSEETMRYSWIWSANETHFGEFLRNDTMFPIPVCHQILDYILKTKQTYSHVLFIEDLDDGINDISLSPLGIIHSFGVLGPNKAFASASKQVLSGSFGSIVTPIDYSSIHLIQTPYNQNVFDWIQYICKSLSPNKNVYNNNEGSQSFNRNDVLQYKRECEHELNPLYLSLILSQDKFGGTKPYAVKSIGNGPIIYPLSFMQSNGTNNAGPKFKPSQSELNLPSKESFWINPKWKRNMLPYYPQIKIKLNGYFKKNPIHSIYTSSINSIKSFLFLWTFISTLIVTYSTMIFSCSIYYLYQKIHTLKSKQKNINLNLKMN